MDARAGSGSLAARLTLVLGLALLALAVYYLPLAVFGYPAPGHDYAHHHAMLRDFRAGLAEGVLYPRWAGDPNWGLGAATFYYYPPLGYYAAALGQFVTGDPDHGFHLIGAILSALGALACFALIRRDTGPRPAAAGAVLYLLLPYPAYVLWHRFAWAEFCALAWMPVLFLAARLLIDGPRPRIWFFLTVGFAGIAATHLLSALVFCPLVAAYLVHAALRRRSRALLGLTALSGMTAVAMTAVFLLPIALDRDLVHLEHVESGFHHYLRHFLFLDESLIGYASDPAKREVLPCAAVTFLLLIGAGAAVMAMGRLRARPAFLLVAGLGLSYLATVAAEPVWRLLSFLTILQFPWRLVGPVSFIAVWLFGLALGAAARATPDNRPRRFRLWRADRAAWAAVIPAALAGVTAVGCIAASFGGEDPRGERGIKARVVVVEYLPQAVSYEALADYLPLVPTEAHAVATRGTASVETRRWTPHHRVLRLDVGPEGADLVPLVFDFPGWQARLDGRPIATTPVPRLGLAMVTVPPGAHTLELVNEPSGSRRIGGWLSLVGLVAALALARLARGIAVGPSRPLLGPRRAAWLVGMAAVVAAGVALMAPFPALEPSAVLITVGDLTRPRVRDANLDDPETLAGRFTEMARLFRFRGARAPDEPAPALVARLLGAPDRVESLRSRGYATGAVLARDLCAGSVALARAFPEARVVEPELLAVNAGVWIAEHAGRPFLLWVHLDAEADGEGVARALSAAERVLKSLGFNYGFEPSFVAVAGLPVRDGDDEVFLAMKFPGDVRKGSRRAIPLLPETDLLRIAPSLADALALPGASSGPGSLRNAPVPGGP